MAAWTGGVLFCFLMFSLGIVEGNFCGGMDCGDKPCCLDDQYAHVCCSDEYEDQSAVGAWWFWFCFAGGLFILVVCCSACIRSRHTRQQRRYLIIRRPVMVVPSYGTEGPAPVLSTPYPYLANGQQPPPYTAEPAQKGQPPPYN